VKKENAEFNKCVVKIVSAFFFVELSQINFIFRQKESSVTKQSSFRDAVMNVQEKNRTN
jgi:hypothetical protein